jgi:hypothetical protein
MARQDTSSSLHIERASPERRYGELWKSKVDVEQRGAEGDATRISRRLVSRRRKKGEAPTSLSTVLG